MAEIELPRRKNRYENRQIQMAVRTLFLVCALLWLACLPPMANACVATPADVAADMYGYLRGLVTNDDPASKLRVYTYMYTTDDNLSEEQVHDAVQLLIDAAEDGLPVAQYNLGVIFKTGQWLDSDMEQSLAWTVESATSGFLEGQISSGDMFHDAAAREEDQERRKILLENSEYWLRTALERPAIDEASRLYAQMLLSKTLNFETLLNEDAWLLMLDAACKGQPAARVLLEHNTNIIRKWVAENDGEAAAILEFVDSYDKSDCEAAK